MCINSNINNCQQEMNNSQKSFDFPSQILIIIMVLLFAECLLFPDAACPVSNQPNACRSRSVCLPNSFWSACNNNIELFYYWKYYSEHESMGEIIFMQGRNKYLPHSCIRGKTYPYEIVTHRYVSRQHLSRENTYPYYTSATLAQTTQLLPC